MLPWLRDQLQIHPPSQLEGGERRIVSSPPFKAASRLGEPPALAKRRLRCRAQASSLDEKIRSQEGCQERLEGEVGGPFHVPIFVIKSFESAKPHT